MLKKCAEKEYYCHQYVDGQPLEDPNEEIDRKFRKFADETFKTLTHYRTKRFQSNLTELQKRGLKEVRELIKEGRIRLSVSDNGGEFVVIP
ncbi:hypothetical protein KIN20_030263 [Parelaphostrongylus tenuis]|uniref:Uncharacterized protein n=1 Tax=Parelaphostrongylus tenuis TaxID=148309 RepID=A0AAD5R3W3_PARTN|nr:hypothetical protein KIN20_030263 [Parelaphostrongylus tenuis]